MVRSNYAFELAGSLATRARVRRIGDVAPSARLRRPRSAAQRER